MRRPDVGTGSQVVPTSGRRGRGRRADVVGRCPETRVTVDAVLLSLDEVIGRSDTATSDSPRVRPYAASDLAGVRAPFEHAFAIRDHAVADNLQGALSSRDDALSIVAQPLLGPTGNAAVLPDARQLGRVETSPFVDALATEQIGLVLRRAGFDPDEFGRAMTAALEGDSSRSPPRFREGSSSSPWERRQLAWCRADHVGRLDHGLSQTATTSAEAPTTWADSITS